MWGTAADGEDVTWGSSGEDAELFDNPDADPITFDDIPLDAALPAPLPRTPAAERTGWRVMLGGGL